VLEGIDAAQARAEDQDQRGRAEGLQRHEIPELMRWAHGRGMDLTVIETMPMGEIDADRTDQYLPLSQLRADLERQFTLTDIPTRPAARRAMSTSRRPAGGSASSRR
jgi:cyclic pyranopterin phosphate synthase